MDKNEAVKLAQRYSAEVKRQLNPNKVVLFGSYAKDNHRDESDIDVAVIFNDFGGDWLNTSALLWRLRRNISDVIEPILLDEAEDKSGFVREILRTGMVL